MNCCHRIIKKMTRIKESFVFLLLFLISTAYLTQVQDQQKAVTLRQPAPTASLTRVRSTTQHGSESKNLNFNFDKIWDSKGSSENWGEILVRVAKLPFSLQLVYLSKTSL